MDKIYLDQFSNCLAIAIETYVREMIRDAWNGSKKSAELKEDLDRAINLEFRTLFPELKP